MRLGGVLTLLALIWLWLVDTQIPDVATDGEPGPRALPFLLGIILALLGVALMFQPGPKGPGLHSSGDVGRVPPSTSDREAQADPPNDPPMGRTAIATVALLLVYAFLLDKAGFISSTAVLMLAAMAGVLGMRRWLFMIVFAVAFAVGTWLVFNTLLGIPLPRDPWLAALQ